MLGRILLSRPTTILSHATDRASAEEAVVSTESPAARQSQWSVAPYFLVDDVVATSTYYRDALGFGFERLWGDPPVFCMVRRQGVTLMLAQAETRGLMRPNHVADPERHAWDAYIWIDDADGLYAEYRARGVTISREVCDQPYGCRDFEVDDCNGYRLCFGQDMES